MKQTSAFAFYCYAALLLATAGALLSLPRFLMAVSDYNNPDAVALLDKSEMEFSKRLEQEIENKQITTGTNFFGIDLAALRATIQSERVTRVRYRAGRTMKAYGAVLIACALLFGAHIWLLKKEQVAIKRFSKIMDEILSPGSTRAEDDYITYLARIALPHVDYGQLGYERFKSNLQKSFGERFGEVEPYIPEIWEKAKRMLED